ncbi:MAG: 4-hydroxy-3-methylbut-2-enyl diphosphate reductase [Streptosporangiales bacterium]|nr:4-hydroxy-3-methylbut-2-enyl diphosphate reductase [Streptosporangiales bacterium]
MRNDSANTGANPRLLVCAPLAIEARSVRRGLDGPADASVVRTGYGTRRARRTAEALRGRPFDAQAVVGFGGAVRGDLAPGDVVVATEVIDRAVDGGRTIPCPSAELLAGELRREGLTVHTGPIVTADHIVGAAERAELGGRGALAVDMESGALAEAAEGRPFAVVRVVVDTPDRPLRSPSTVRAGWRATAALRRVGPALARWGRAAGSRNVLLAAPRSFCAGVERAIEVVERALELYDPPVYVRKQIVHNVHVVRDLERRGAVFVEELDEVPEGATAVFSAHGVSPAVRAEAEDRGLTVIDATCPLVTKVHNEARRFAYRGNLIVLIGHARHEETEGTLGEVPDSSVLVETPEDVAKLRVEDPDRVAYLMQTTLATDEAQVVVDAIRERFPTAEGPTSEDICYATTNRQDAVRAVAADADLLLVVGSINSSNSKRLVEVARRAGTPAYLVDDPGGIELDWLAGSRTVGLTAGASAPPALVEEVIGALRGLGPVEVEERTVTTEQVHFTLPKEVRP